MYSIICPTLSPSSIRVDAKLSLSTASPSIGGVPPKLETCKLTLLHYEEPQRKSKGMVRTYYSFGSGGALQPMKRLGAARSAPPLATPQAKVTEGLSSSVFEITVPATIPSDNSAHKVSTQSVYSIV